MRSPFAFLKGLAGTREGEATRLFLMAAYLLLIITCYTTLKAVRDSLFVIEIGPLQLPYLYVSAAVTMAIISAAYPRALRRMGLYALVRRTSYVAVASLVSFWWLVSHGGRASFYLLYVWVSLFGAITTSQAWSLATHLFDAREARRSFAWIGLGGVLGGITGGMIAGILAPRAGTETLLPICATLMLISVAIASRLARFGDSGIREGASATSDSPNASGPAIFTQIKESPYVPMLILLLLSSVVVEAFVDYEFKVIAHEAFDSKDRLTSFFGTIASYGGGLALIVQALITSPLLRRFGVSTAILLLPSALLAGSLLVAAQPTLWAVSVLKLIDGSLSYSVHRSGMELLYVPLPVRVRASVKALIDLLVDRVGRATGGLFLLLLTAGWSLSIPALSVVASVCLIVWLGIALLVRHDYIQAFRAALEKKVIEPEAIEVHALDHTIIQTLVDALSGRDDRQVLYALDLLRGRHPARWQHHLPTLLEHQSPAVRSRTIALLTEWKVTSPLVSARLSDPELDVRLEAVRYLCLASAEPERKLKELLCHEDYGVVLAAIHGMARYQLGGPGLIEERLIEKALMTEGHDGVNARSAAARAVAIAGLAGKESFLERLLGDPSTPVLREAIRTAAEVRYERAIPVLVSMLARAPLRRDAREALLKLGPAAFSELRSRFRDDHTPIEVRSRIPKVLSFSGRQDIADFLLGAVHDIARPLDMPLLKALNRMRSLDAEIEFDRDRTCALIHEECERHQRLTLIRRAIQPASAGGGGDCADDLLLLLDKAIGERLSEEVEKVFRLLGLLYSPADIHSIYFSLTTRPALRASAIEFLDTLIESRLSALVIPLLEDGGENDRTTLDRCLSREEAVQLLLEGDDEWLQTISKELAARGGFEGVLFSKLA